MVSNFSTVQLHKFFGLIHHLVNRNQGMHQQVMDWTSDFPYPTQPRNFEVCGDRNYADFFHLKCNLEDDLAFIAPFTVGSLKNSFSLISNGFCKSKKADELKAEIKTIELLARNLYSNAQQFLEGNIAFGITYIFEWR